MHDEIMMLKELGPYGWLGIVVYLIYKDKFANPSQERTNNGTLNTNSEMADLYKRVSEMELRKVDEDRVAQMIAHEIAPIIDSQREIKVSLAKITEIVTEIRIQQARTEGQRPKNEL